VSESTTERASRVLAVYLEWDSAKGSGGSTVNRELCVGLAEAGADVTCRIAEAADGPELMRGVRVQGLEPIPGVDPRGQLLRTENLPDPGSMDVVIGHAKFSGGAAGWLRDNFYPEAQLVQFSHYIPDELDRWRGDPEQADRHTETERRLMAAADLVVGIGPLLAEESARLLRAYDNPPPVHEMIPGISVYTPIAYPAEQQRFHVLVFGRADDPLKGAAAAAEMVGALRQRGIDVHLTVRGARPNQVREQEVQLSRVAHSRVRVKPFTTDQVALAHDLTNSDLVVVPSMHGGFELTLTESIGHGVPVLVSDAVGAGMFLADPRRIPAELGQQLVVPSPRDLNPQSLVNAWTERMAGILADPEAARQRARALQDYCGTRYTWRHAAEGLQKALAENAARQARATARPLTERQQRQRGRAAAAQSRLAVTPRNASTGDGASAVRSTPPPQEKQRRR